MDPNKTDIDEEQFNEDELDEQRSDVQLNEDELDEQGSDVQFNGDELSDSGSDVQFNGDELSDSGSDAQFNGDELSDSSSDERFNGDELSDSGSDERLTGKEPDRSGGIIEKETVPVGSLEKHKDSILVDEAAAGTGKKTITIVHKISGIIILVCLLVSAVYFFILRQPKTEDTPVTAKKITAKIEKKALAFEPFIVPLEGNKYYTYILIDISFDVSGKNSHLEMTEKQSEIRKIIYDILLKKIKGAESIPPVVDLKNDIKTGINAVLENGKIQEVFVTNYNAV